MIMYNPLSASLCEATSDVVKVLDIMLLVNELRTAEEQEWEEMRKSYREAPSIPAEFRWRCEVGEVMMRTGKDKPLG